MRIIRVYATITITLAVAIGAAVFWWAVARNRTVTLSLSSGQEGGVYYPLATSIADVVKRTTDRIRIEVVETDGTGENLKNIATGQTDLAIVQNDVSGHRAVRTLVPLHNGVLHFWVLESSEINGITDLQDKTIAVGLPESGTPELVAALFAHYEIGGGRTKLEELSLPASCEALKSGAVDAILMTMGLKSSAFEKLVEETPVRLVPIGEETGPGSEIEGFRLSYPFVQPRAVPRYAYAPPREGHAGVPPQSTPAIGVRAILVGHENLPRRIAKELTGILVENKSALAKMHPSAAELTEHFDAATLQFPIHSGATAYYQRDEPGFLRQNAELLGFLSSLIVGIAGFVLAARKWLDQRQKDRIDAYYLDLDRILSKLRESELSGDDLRKMESELQSIRRNAVALLAAEKLLPNESFRIFQSLLNDCESAVARRAERNERS